MADHPQQPGEPARSRTHARGARWRNAAAPALPVFACFLGGATEKWAEGLVVALLGLLLLIDPPRVSLGRWLNLTLLALIALAAFAFLPARFVFLPEWRVALTNDFAIRLPSTISPQPWITFGCFLSFVAGLSWLYFVTAQDVEQRGARVQLRVFTAGIITLALTSIILYRLHSALPFWHNQRNFGPFPNRNQTANLFALASIIVLACVHDDVRKRKKRWVAWIVGLGILIIAIVLDFSRAGIALLVVGAGAWLAVFALRKHSAGGIAIGISLLLGLLTTMLVFGGQTLERFQLRAGAVGVVTSDFRWLIFRDAFDLIRASPWCGLGLGNFEPVFAIFRSASQGDTRALHPESDWLWLVAELGWPAILLILAGAALMIRWVFPLQEGTNQRFRLAALIASLLFALHGVVDVSGHRIGTAFAAIFLLGLAVRRPTAFRSSRVIPIVSRAAGIILLATGCVWTAGVRNRLSIPGAIGAENAKRAAISASRGHEFSEAIRRASSAAEWAPLDWQIYFIRAIAEVGAKEPIKVALDDFRRARFLEPNAYEVPFEEGKLWLPRDATLALTAWREALRRAGTQRVEIFSSMLSWSSAQNSTVAASLEELGRLHHDLTIVYLGRVSPAAFTAAVDRLLERDPDLLSLNDGEKAALFRLWGERGEPGHLARAVEAHPAWMTWAWSGMAKSFADKGDFHAAFDLVEHWAPPAAMPSTARGAATLEQLKREVFSGSNNFSAGFTLYSEQMRQRQTEDALGTIRHFTEQGHPPAYFHYLEAKAWAANGNWERAWKAWQTFEAADKEPAATTR